LKLDHNNIGGEGVNNLSHGLAINKTITSLSLTYCNIDHSGARAIFEILIYSQSQLEELNLSGNHLRNAGIITVFRGISINKNLKKIFLADNQFGEEEEVLEAIRDCWFKNKTLARYDIRYNKFEDTGILSFFFEVHN
jgi:Ran GTPase-activating protein (RanGAP) involved in mRNA processing and transport